MPIDFSRVLLVSALLLLAGCAGSGRGFYQPNPDAFPLGPIIEFSANKDIDLISGWVSPEYRGQLSPEQIAVAQLGHRRGSLFVSPMAWTDTAIAILRREFNNRLTRVVQGAEKKLILSVERVSVEQGSVGWQFLVHMKAETGNGDVKTFVGEAQARSASRAADAALIRAVAEVLKDYDIWKYRQE